MAVLKTAIAGALLAGCYSPALPDCVVACADEDDCAPAQTCGSDGFCATVARAGRCASATPIDAARPADAARCELTIQIEGKGRVVIDGLVECSHMAPGDTCTFDLPVAPHDLIAIAEDDDVFDRWTSVACLAQDESCYLAHCTATTTVGVKFVRDG